jgi:ATP-dependent RNA helicase RhlB
VILLPALQWLLSGESRRVLVVVPDEIGADRFTRALRRLGAEADIGSCRVSQSSEGIFEIEGDPTAPVLIGSPDQLQAVPDLHLRDFGFLVVDGADRIAELDAESLRKFIGLLLPSWERRSILACAKLSAKTKNLAWDLADNPAEISIEGEAAKAESVPKETWRVPDDSKMKFLLGLLGREADACVCVFCNLRDTTEEVSRRLGANGVASDFIVGALAVERKAALVDKARSRKLRCLVLTDQGAEHLDTGVFPLVVNYDIPLEPEFFIKRLEMLDRSSPGAKLVSLACDRYICGLGAVESYIDAKLDALPPSEDMLCAVDKSEGLAKRRDTSAYQEPLRRQENRGPRRGGNRREDARRDLYARDGNLREDRSPDIRKSISEATGGALDMGGGKYPTAKPTARPPQSKRQEPPRGTNGQDKRSPRPEPQRGGSKPVNRGTAKATNHGRQQAPRTNNAKPPSRQGNPYDMPIEERMKLYREKYGQRFGDGKPKRGQPSPSASGSTSAPTEPRREPHDKSEEKNPSLFGRLFNNRKDKKKE